MNNMALLGNASAVYNPNACPTALNLVSANCIACHATANLVSGNLAQFAGANTLYNTQTEQIFTMNTLESSLNSGGAMCNVNDSSPTLVNCTFSANAASAAMYSDGSSTATVTNCILWDGDEAEIDGSATVTYSCVQGGYNGNGNIGDDPGDDPLFVNAASGNLRLSPYSPCINAGTPVEDPENDIRGVPRPQEVYTDMGAYEYYVFAITTQPQPQSVLEGHSASFSVEVSGGLEPESISYQWQKDGMDLSYATDSVYTISSVQSDNKGNYTCLVADDYEKLVSDIARLTVLTGMPVVGGLGLAAAVLATGLLGALRLRRRKG